MKHTILSVLVGTIGGTIIGLGCHAIQDASAGQGQLVQGWNLIQVADTTPRTDLYCGDLVLDWNFQPVETLEPGIVYLDWCADLPVPTDR